MGFALIFLPLVGGGWLAAGAAGGTAAYYACVSACSSGAAAGGLLGTIMTAGVAAPAATGVTLYGISACTAACSSLAAGAAFFTGPACFADDSMTTVSRNGTVISIPVQNLVPGMSIETFDTERGTRKWTEVVSMNRVEEPSKHVRVTVQKLSETPSTAQLTVTTEHLVARMRGTAEGHDLELVLAGDLRLNDYVPLYAEKYLVPARVTHVEPMALHHRNILVTRDGTVMANGLLTTTVCDGEWGIKVDERGNFTQALQNWRKIHEPMFTNRTVVPVMPSA